MRINVRANLGHGCLIAFLLPFCAVGVVTGVLAVQRALQGRWGEAGFLGIFAIVFGGVGFGLIAASFYGRRLARELEQRKADFPDQPWMWRPDWATGTIRGGNRGAMLGSAIFATLWNRASGSGCSRGPPRTTTSS